MFKGIKKLIIMLVSGILVMTHLTGCVISNDSSVVENFNEFLEMFPSEDLTFLYDKEGETSSVNGEKLKGKSNLVEGDLGQWCISSSISIQENVGEDYETFHTVLWFDRESRTATGKVSLWDEERDEEYYISYDEKGIHLDDENAPDYIKEGLSKFRLMYEYISLDKEYMKSLEMTGSRYNSNVPKFSVQYKLKPDDKNIAKIKEIYPEIVVDANNCTLKLEGDSEPWDTLGTMSLNISVDKERKIIFRASMSFGRSGGLY
ncbi:MAG: Csa1 family protein [Sarcina sp.]